MPGATPAQSADAGRPTGSNARRSAWLIAGIGLLALVALTSRSESFTGATLPNDLFSPLDAIEVLGYVAFLTGIVLLPVVMVFARQQRRRLAAHPRAASGLTSLPRWASALGLLVVVAVVIGQLVALWAYLDDIRRSQDGALPGPSGLPAPSEVAMGPGRDPATLAIAVVIVAVLAVVAVVALLVWGRAIRPETDTRVAGPRATSQALEVGLDALRRERDPRRAVISAYAAMSRSLTRVGLAREEFEAPMEYLRRVLHRSAGVALEAETITRLFQLAMFSRQEIDESMRATAIASLERLRDTTEAPA